jgi:Tfp pilus assembly protein PilF
MIQTSVKAFEKYQCKVELMYNYLEAEDPKTRRARDEVRERVSSSKLTEQMWHALKHLAHEKSTCPIILVLLKILHTTLRF